MLLEEDVGFLLLPPGTDDGAGWIGGEDLIRLEEAEELADGGEFADAGDARQFLAGQEMHEALDIGPPHPLWNVEVHPDAAPIGTAEHSGISVKPGCSTRGHLLLVIPRTLS